MIKGEIPAVSIMTTVQDVFDLNWNATLEEIQTAWSIVRLIPSRPFFDGLTAKI